MDICIKIKDILFNFRVCAIIENNGRYLLKKANDVDFYSTPGGRVHTGEDTVSALKRELKEELNMDLDTSKIQLMHVSEDFFTFREQKMQEINFVYHLFLDNDNPLTHQDSIKNLDSDKEMMYWVDKDKLQSLKILPEYIYNIPTDKDFVHTILHK